MVHLDLSPLINDAVDQALQAKLPAIRDGILTEAAEIPREHGADCCAGEHVDAHVQLLLAARAGQES